MKLKALEISAEAFSAFGSYFNIYDVDENTDGDFSLTLYYSQTYSFVFAFRKLSNSIAKIITTPLTSI